MEYIFETKIKENITNSRNCPNNTHVFKEKNEVAKPYSPCLSPRNEANSCCMTPHLPPSDVVDLVLKSSVGFSSPNLSSAAFIPPPRQSVYGCNVGSWSVIYIIGSWCVITPVSINSATNCDSTNDVVATSSGCTHTTLSSRFPQENEYMSMCSPTPIHINEHLRNNLKYKEAIKSRNIRTFTHHKGRVQVVLFNAFLQLCLSIEEPLSGSSYEDRVYLWCPYTLDIYVSFFIPYSYDIKSAQFAPDGNTLFIVLKDDNHTLLLYNNINNLLYEYKHNKDDVPIKDVTGKKMDTNNNAHSHAKTLKSVQPSHILSCGRVPINGISVEPTPCISHRRTSAHMYNTYASKAEKTAMKCNNFKKSDNTGSTHINGTAFTSLENGAMNTRFVTYGLNHLRIWTYNPYKDSQPPSYRSCCLSRISSKNNTNISSGNMMKVNSAGILMSNVNNKNNTHSPIVITAVDFLSESGNIIAATADGRIYIYSGITPIRSFQVPFCSSTILLIKCLNKNLFSVVAQEGIIYLLRLVSTNNSNNKYKGSCKKNDDGNKRDLFVYSSVNSFRNPSKHNSAKGTNASMLNRKKSIHGLRPHTSVTRRHSVTGGISATTTTINRPQNRRSKSPFATNVNDSIGRTPRSTYADSFCGSAGKYNRRRSNSTKFNRKNVLQRRYSTRSLSQNGKNNTCSKYMDRLCCSDYSYTDQHTARNTMADSLSHNENGATSYFLNRNYVKNDGQIRIFPSTRCTEIKRIINLMDISMANINSTYAAPNCNDMCETTDHTTTDNNEANRICRNTHMNNRINSEWYKQIDAWLPNPSNHINSLAWHYPFLLLSTKTQMLVFDLSKPSKDDIRIILEKPLGCIDANSILRYDFRSNIGPGQYDYPKPRTNERNDILSVHRELLFTSSQDGCLKPQRRRFQNRQQHYSRYSNVNENSKNMLAESCPHLSSLKTKCIYTSPLGPLVATGGRCCVGGELRIWKVNEGRQAALPLFFPSGVTAISWDWLWGDDGSVLAVGCENGKLYLFLLWPNKTDGGPLVPLLLLEKDCSSKAIACATMNTKRMLLATGNVNGQINCYTIHLNPNLRKKGEIDVTNSRVPRNCVRPNSWLSVYLDGEIRPFNYSTENINRSDIFDEANHWWAELHLCMNIHSPVPTPLKLLQFSNLDAIEDSSLYDNKFCSFNTDEDSNCDNSNTAQTLLLAVGSGAAVWIFSVPDGKAISYGQVSEDLLDKFSPLHVCIPPSIGVNPDDRAHPQDSNKLREIVGTRKKRVHGPWQLPSPSCFVSDGYQTSCIVFNEEQQSLDIIVPRGFDNRHALKASVPSTLTPNSTEKENRRTADTPAVGSKFPLSPFLRGSGLRSLWNESKDMLKQDISGYNTSSGAIARLPSDGVSSSRAALATPSFCKYDGAPTSSSRATRKCNQNYAVLSRTTRIPLTSAPPTAFLWCGLYKRGINYFTFNSPHLARRIHESSAICEHSSSPDEGSTTPATHHILSVHFDGFMLSWELSTGHKITMHRTVSGVHAPNEQPNSQQYRPTDHSLTNRLQTSGCSSPQMEDFLVTSTAAKDVEDRLTLNPPPTNPTLLTALERRKQFRHRLIPCQSAGGPNVPKKPPLQCCDNRSTTNATTPQRTSAVQRRMHVSKSPSTSKLGANAVGKIETVNDDSTSHSYYTTNEGATPFDHSGRQYEVIETAQQESALIQDEDLTRQTSEEAIPGRFLYRTAMNFSCFEVEVYLPGGNVEQVRRNSKRNQLVFVGRMSKPVWKIGSTGNRNVNPNELRITIPTEYDISSPKLVVEQNVEDGHCYICVPSVCI